MTRPHRSLAVTATLAAGALGIISSTQTWLEVTLTQGSGAALPVAGAAAIPVLAPLSLAVLALGAALSIVGLVLRYVFGAMSVAIAAILGWLTGVVAFQRPASAAASTVTEATGITGPDAMDDLVTRITLTPWPYVTLLAWALLLAAGIYTLVTARSWRRSGRRYATAPAHTGAADAPAAPSAPLDSIDSWDDLSRGDDPTR